MNEEENSYGEGEEEEKDNYETSILERHNKITNNISRPESPMNKSSIRNTESGVIRDSNEAHRVGFNTSNDIDNDNNQYENKTKITSIKTEKDITEDIHIESSHEEKGKEEIEQKNLNNNNNNNHQLLIDLPQSFLNSVKYLRMKHQKEKLNSFMKFHKTPETNKEQLLLTTPKNNNKSLKEEKSILKKNNINATDANTTPLPRIASASNLSNPMTLKNPPLAMSNSKHIKLGIPYRNQNIRVIPIPKEDRRLLLLEKENKGLFNELQTVNQQLNILINKRLKQKPEVKTQDAIHPNEIKEIEKNSMKKVLERLIDEYNQLYKVYYVCKDNESKDKLEDQLVEITKQYNDKLKTNQDLQSKIKMNEYYLLNSKSEQVSILQNIALLDAKNELLKKKSKEEEREQERMLRLIVNEEERIKLMKEKLIKLKEILAFYEETPESILHKDTEMGEKRELAAKYESLKKRINIIQHSRLSSSKAYQIDISNQKKDIDHLQKTIKEVNDILDSLN